MYCTNVRITIWACPAVEAGRAFCSKSSPRGEEPGAVGFPRQSLTQNLASVIKKCPTTGKCGTLNRDGMQQSINITKKIVV